MVFVVHGLMQLKPHRAARWWDRLCRSGGRENRNKQQGKDSSRGGSHEQHVKAGQQSHKGSGGQQEQSGSRSNQQGSGSGGQNQKK